MWILAAIAALALGVASVMVGWNILPSPSKASEAGTFIPLLVAWSVVLVSAGSSLALAKFILGARSRS